MAYTADKKPGELTALTSLATDDIIVVGDTSDVSEVAKGITKANLITDLGSSFATAAHNHTGVYAPVLGADDNYVTDAEKVVIGNTSGTNSGDNAVNSNYSGLVTNATHTGDATGSGALTVVKINGTSLAGLATGVLKNTTTTGVPFISKVALTEPATASTLTIADGQTLTVNGSATITNGTHSGTNTGDNTVATALTGTPSVTVATVTTTGNIELGHASDTTVARVSAGVASIEGNNIVTANMAASAANINTGTSTTVFNTPDALAGSNLGIRYAQCTLNGTTALTTSEKVYFRIPAALTGMNLVSVTGTVGTGAAGSSSSGTPTFTVKNVTDANQMLSTSLTIDASEYTSATAATPAVINASFDDVVTDDLIEVAVTTAGTGVTYATVTLGFQLP